ncbi:MAG TPA: hypothetical protein VE398_08495 [Acidobacteriota bacterium]|nr:hypothetical protein [Acidobacteriota bacterium]
MGFALMLSVALLAQGPPRPLVGQAPKADSQPPEKSGYFAFVDREYIFTMEIVKPGVPILNFVCMGDKQSSLLAKEIRIALDNRKVPGKLFAVDTGDPKEPMITPLLRIRPRSSFGVRLEGEFGDVRELYGVTVRLGQEDFKLVPLTSFDFENLALKINKLNLGSPDFSDDWRVLKLETCGTRVSVRR